MMNMFIYTENGDLHIRKPNGLEYCFNNTDKPNLGFEYDVVVYDNEEIKIVNWQDDVPFEDQLKENLSDIEIDAIEQYIDNSEAPAGVSLASQYSDKLNEMCHKYIQSISERYGFGDIVEVLAAGRQGSNHPYRSDARRVLEYSDTVWNVYVGLIEEIQNTREDVLPEYGVFANQLPKPHAVPNI